LIRNPVWSVMNCQWSLFGFFRRVSSSPFSLLRHFQFLPVSSIPDGIIRRSSIHWIQSIRRQIRLYSVFARRCFEKLLYSRAYASKNFWPPYFRCSAGFLALIKYAQPFDVVQLKSVYKDILTFNISVFCSIHLKDRWKFREASWYNGAEELLWSIRGSH
jgi:hypothetical protein